MAEAALFQALEVLTQRNQTLTQEIQVLAEIARGGGNGGGRQWDHVDRYKNLKVFDGNSKDFEEWNVKFRSLINAGNPKVGRLLKAVEHECSEEELAKNEYDQLQPEFDERDLSFVNESSAQMLNLLLNITTGEANSVVRRSLGSGWLAWKRLTSPRVSKRSQRYWRHQGFHNRTRPTRHWMSGRTSWSSWGRSTVKS